MADYSKLSDKDLDNQIMEKQKSLSPYHAMSDDELDAAIHDAQGTSPTTGGLDAANIKAQEGATLGLRPVVAGIGAAAGDLYGQAIGNQPFDLGQTGNAFNEARRTAIGEQKQASKDHPGISAAANIAGSLVTAPFLPATAGLKGAMMLGTGLGAAQAAGSAESLGDAATDVVGGAVGGAAAHGIAKSVGSIAQNALNGFAENRAFQASGAMLKDFRAAFNNEPEKINELGRTMLNNGLAKAGDSVKSIAQKSEALKRQTGKQIGQVYDKVLDILTEPGSNIPPEIIHQVQSAGFHPELQAEEMKTVVAAALKGRPGSTQAINKANQVIDELAMNGNNLTPDHALELKGGVDDMINWSKKAADLPLDQEALKIVRNQIQGRLDNQVGMIDQVLGNKQSADLKNLNRLYGNVSTIANISRDRALRDMANQSVSLGDKMGGGLGALAGMGVAVAGHGGAESLAPMALGAIGLGLNHGARKFGNAGLASVVDSLGRGIANPATYAPGLGNAIEGNYAIPGKAAEGPGVNVPRMSTTIKARKPASR